MFLPEFDRDYLVQKNFDFEEKVEGGTNGLIINNWILPLHKFNMETSNLLILIPSGYPDVPPDMWYFNPDILLKPSNTFARATEAKINFNGIVWQRWSRHLAPNEWRSGTDGIHSYLIKVQTALEVAS